MKDQDQRRERLRADGSPQTTSTRSQLAAAYRSAAAERVDRISIRSLCEHAGVARSTFYTHFSAVEDLAAFVITEDLEHFARTNARSRATGTSGAIAAHEGLIQVVRSFTHQRDLLAYTFASVSRPVVVDRMIDFFATYMNVAVAAELSGAEARASRLVVGFISAGVVHTVIEWLTAPDQVDEEQLVDTLVGLLPRALRS